MMEFLLAHPWLLAMAIFCARILDVSLGTVRTITVVRGFRFMAAFIGFFEVMIWIMAAGQVLRHVDQWYMVIAYAGGFATGNIVGIFLEERLALGNVMVRVISETPDFSLADRLAEEGYAVTSLQGLSHPERFVEIILLAEERRKIPNLLKFLDQVDPKASYTIEDLRSVHQSMLRHGKRSTLWGGWRSTLKRR